MNSLDRINARHSYLKDEMDKFSAHQSKFQKDFDEMQDEITQGLDAIDSSSKSLDDMHDKIMQELDGISSSLDELLADI